MGNLSFFHIILMAPVFVAVLLSRGIWTGLLAILAGMGVGVARSDSEPGDKTTAEMVKCYKQVIVKTSLMKDARWSESKLLNAWAAAERDVIKCLMLGQSGYDLLEDKVDVASHAGEAALDVVAQGLLSEESYGMARQILGEWHADVVTGYGGVKCYDRMAMPPIVDDVSTRIFTLVTLRKEGKVSFSTVEQVQAGMTASLLTATTPEVANELSGFLVDLLGFL